MKALLGCDIELPCYFVGDAVFSLSNHLIKPFPGKYFEKIFYYRLSRSGRVIENTFGILSSRLKILKKAIYSYPENVDKIVMTCVSPYNSIAIKEQLCILSSILH